MIELTRLNGTAMILNSDLIKTAEASPDTMLTLINGEKLIVREELGDVVERVLAYRAQLLATVATRLSSLNDLPQVISMTSLDAPDQDLLDQSDPAPKAPQRSPLRTFEG